MENQDSRGLVGSRLYARTHMGFDMKVHASLMALACTNLHEQSGYVHICIESPPKHSVASVLGFLKGKSASAMARQLSGRERNFTGEPFWARGSAGSTVGFELEQVRAYIRDPQRADEEGRL